MRVGVFGGTFNPIHLGHLLLAETARDVLELDRVLFVPTGQPPHKPVEGLLPGPVRFELIQLAVRDHSGFAVSEIELERQGPSYTIDTMRLLRRELPHDELFLLIGEDMLKVKWLAWGELKRLCTIIVAQRPSPGTPPKAGWAKGVPRAERLAAGRATTFPRRERGVKWLSMPQVDIASSDIRARIARGRSIRYLVPRAVEHAIRQRRLYQR